MTRLQCLDAVAFVCKDRPSDQTDKGIAACDGIGHPVRHLLYHSILKHPHPSSHDRPFTAAKHFAGWVCKVLCQKLNGHECGGMGRADL